jgi:hypothetical protein
MREELDQAYKLIRAGQIVEATSILEKLIRENPDNEDAWWLLANATYAPDAKRNALNNVIRLSQNAERRAKASTILNELSLDRYSFDSPQPSYSSFPDYKEKTRHLERGGGRFVLIGIGLLGVLAFVACFAFFTIMVPLMEMPETYEQMGVLEEGIEREGVLDDNAIHGYQLHIGAGQRVRITARKGSVDSSPPYLFLYDSAGRIVTISSEAGQDYIRLEELILLEGDYTLVLREDFAFGEGAYILEYEIVE